MPRWTQRPDERPREIIAAALALFAEKGFAATRVEEIAARSGLSKAGVYLYFPTKAEIFKATVRETILTTVSRMEAMAQAFDGPSEELLRRAISEMARMVGDSAAGAIPRIVMSEAGNFPDIAEFYVKEVVSRGLTVLSGIIARGQARGEFAEDLGPLTPFIAIGPILTLSMWNHGLGRVLNRPLPTGMFAEDMLKVIGRGLRTEGGR